MTSSTIHKQLLLLLLFLLLVNVGARPRRRRQGGSMNPIDRCWRRDRNWAADRQRLAMCSVGFAGKMTNNAGRGLRRYTVSDDGDDPLTPRPGTLRYGVTVLQGKVWIEFERDMVIRLKGPLMIKSYTAIDGRGAKVEIANGAGFMLDEVTDVIIHGLHFHHNSAQPPVTVMGPGGKPVRLGQMDGDALRLVGCSKVWVDHNTFYRGQDGLLDVTRGSTDVTISNNWFHHHDKVMLLGHDDAFVHDRTMRVTIAFNRFGPRANQRMPRIRYGYAHVVNNLYDVWGIYAIGGSAGPTIRSEANFYIAPRTENKDVTWKEVGAAAASSWNWQSVGDVFIDGAFFPQTGSGSAVPVYNRDQRFPVARAADVRSLTRNAGALRCLRGYRC